MANQLFSIAAQEHKGSARETKRRKTVIIGALVFAIAFIGHGIFHLKDFPLNIPFQQAVLIHENQAILIRAGIDFSIGLSVSAFSVFILYPSLWSFAIFLILSVLMSGIIVYSDAAGFEIVRRRGLSSAYFLCFAAPIFAIGLVIDRVLKRRS